MNKLIGVIREQGWKRLFQIIYEVKINNLITKFVSIIFRRSGLKNIIVIESHNDFDCNGGAFYNYLIEHGYNQKYLIVWLLKKKNDIKLPYNVKKFLLHRPSILKSYYISRAKIFTSDNEVVPKARDDQKMYYFDHGSICLKNCKPFFNMSRKKIDYFFSPSPNYDAIYCNQMSIEYPNKKMLYLGYPRHDIFYVDSEKEIEKLTLKKYNKVILWMPTFRKGGGFKRNDSFLDFEYVIPLINTEKDFCEINDILKKNNTLLIIKIHPKQDIDTIKKLKTICFENVFIVDNDVVKEKNIDVFKLLKNTDALISDYSSITYSYILLDKPIAHVFSDVNEFKLGFAMENYEDYVVGEKLYSIEDMKRFINEIYDGKDLYKEKRRKLTNYLYLYQDGKSCERIVEFMNL